MTATTIMPISTVDLCNGAVQSVVRKLGLKTGDAAFLGDLDFTLYGPPDVYQWLVRRYGRDPALWLHADALANRPGSHLSLRHLFQMGLTEIEPGLEDPPFDFDAALSELKKVHVPTPGAIALLGLLRERRVARIAVSNGIDHFAQPLVAHYGFDIEVICNHCEVGAHGSLEFRGLCGEAGVSKEAVAKALEDLGIRVVLGAGDSLADVPLIQHAIASGGIGLVRRGRGLADALPALGVSADSYWLYDEFDPYTLAWVAEKLDRIL